jgi:hypothetical protein
VGGNAASNDKHDDDYEWQGWKNDKGKKSALLITVNIYMSK